MGQFMEAFNKGLLDSGQLAETQGLAAPVESATGQATGKPYHDERTPLGLQHVRGASLEILSSADIFRGFQRARCSCILPARCIPFGTVRDCAYRPYVLRTLCHSP
jgi:hypothetical protein